MRSSSVLVLVVTLSLGWKASSRAQTTPEYEMPPIRYSTTSPTNRVTEYAFAEAGPNRPGSGEKQRLRECLAAFGVPVESQVLVFSKTSLQRKRIEPAHPRAVYFSDEMYVGWVPGGLVEVAVTDPGLGLVFYRVDPRESATPLRFERDAECLTCHAGSMTHQWPGLIVRSVFPDAQGEPITAAGSFLVGHDTPFARRWGGWYVTGIHGNERHMGNAIAQERGSEVVLDREAGANVTRLDRWIDPERYLEGSSDLVALLVLEHQAGMHNRLVQAGLRVRRWVHYQQALQKELGQPVDSEPTGTARRVLESECERVLQHLLFVGEAPLPEGGVRGGGRFEPAFRQNRRVDAQGRSLKDFDLQSRLFRFRCSYMIYSPAFDALPQSLKQLLYARLHEVLTAATPPKPYTHLSDGERLAIRDILIATQPDLTP